MHALLVVALASVLVGPMARAEPDGLPAPTNALISMAAIGKGVQLYRCEADTRGGYGWRRVGPEATLYDAGGRKVGRHFAGPTWQAADGSTVTGQVVATAPSPSGDGLDWLLLRAAPRGLAGAFAKVVYIKRVKTSGGLAPASACTAPAQGRTVRAPYTAEYDFYDAAPPPRPTDRGEP